VSPDPGLLDVQEAAHYVGDISTRTLYREVKRGKLRMVKVGGSTRFRRAELDRYLRASERQSVA
jgi:excisionase family DNA binding protein